MKVEDASPAVRVGAGLTSGLATTLGIFLAIVAAIFMVIAVAVGTFGEVTESQWQTAGAGALKYFPLAMAVMLTTVLLPIYVAQGVTRRQFAVGASLFIAVWSALLALAMVVGYAIEAGVYDALGWSQEFDIPHLFDTWTQVHLIVAEYFPLVAIHMMAGWLIGTTYYVFGWFRATLLLPVSLAPVVVVEGLLATSWIGSALEHVESYTPPHVVIAVPAALAVIAATGAVNYLLIRELPIKLSAA